MVWWYPGDIDEKNDVDKLIRAQDQIDKPLFLKGLVRIKLRSKLGMKLAKEFYKYMEEEISGLPDEVARAVFDNLVLWWCRSVPYTHLTLPTN